MKRAFTVLLALFLLLYGKLGYELFSDQTVPASVTTGSLSDIAEEVLAIPLQTLGKYKIDKARNIQYEGDNLFLINNDILYRFNSSGELCCKITDPEQIVVGSYLIDTVSQRLIVMGNKDDIHFYSLDGKLLKTGKLDNDSGVQRIHAAAMFNNRIWTTEEYCRFNVDTQTYCLEKQVVEYDSSFRKIQSFPLISADLHTKYSPFSSHHYELGIRESTGELYAYSPTLEP